VREKLPKAFWSLYGMEMFFLNSLWSYIQMDLIDSQYQQLVNSSCETTQGSLTELHSLHQRVLKRILHGCFLDNSPSSKQIMSSIDIIMTVINKTCQEVDFSIESRIELREEVLKQLHLVLFDNIGI
jgi:hypothetical protein